MGKQFDVPVVMIVYKRLELTKRSFEPIRQLQPSKLYIIADGARNDEEQEQVFAVREYLDTHIDWECEVHRNYAEHNYGLRYRMPSGMQWVFQTEEQAIFIEDDICATEFFFYYCRELLLKYRDDDRVLMISGCNIFPEHESFGEDDICFSAFSSIWGWACWRRSFEKYDVNIHSWAKIRKNRMIKSILTPKAYIFHHILYDDLQYHWYRTWGYQWSYLMLTGQGLGIVPKYNLLNNIGMGDEDAEHKDDTQERIEQVSNVEIKQMSMPLRCPQEISRNEIYDQYYQEKCFTETYPIWKELKYSIRYHYYNRYRRIIREMEQDGDYMAKLPQKYLLSEEEQVYNHGDRYRFISPREMRATALEYKRNRKNIKR